ncbi:MAG TPA: DUF420 domain-containing protein [Pirellulales bacterium]
MIPGFLGSRASLMFDVVVLAMLAVLPLLAWSIAQAKSGRYELHKRAQTLLAGLILAALVLFEGDVQIAKFAGDSWLVAARQSPYADTWVGPVLTVHLAFAISAFLLWVVTLVLALRRFPSPPTPGSHSALHKKFGWAAAAAMVLTSITGWLFYYLAFVA